MKKKNCVIFDMDGLMLDTERLFLQSSIEIAESMGLKDMDKAGLMVLGVNTQTSLKIYRDFYGQDFDSELFLKKAIELFKEKLEKDGVPKKPGIEELLKHLQSKGYKLGVASSTHEKAVKTELEAAGILQYFDTVVCGDMVQKSKPNPDIFLEACKRLKADPKDAFGLEDSINGIKALYAAGIKAIMVPDLLQPTDEIKHMIYAVKNNLFEVVEMFD